MEVNETLHPNSFYALLFFKGCNFCDSSQIKIQYTAQNENRALFEGQTANRAPEVLSREVAAVTV